MRILFVGINGEHPNVLHRDFRNALAAVSDLFFYGPGYSSENEMKDGILHYIERMGGFDAIVYSIRFARFFSYELVPPKSAYGEHRYLLSQFHVADGLRYADRIVEDLKKVDITKLIFYDWDIGFVNESFYSYMCRMIDNGFYFIGQGAELVPETDGKHYFGPDRITNYYRKLVTENKECVLSLPSYNVGMDAFCWTPIEVRQYDFTASGNMDPTRYPERTEILRAIEKAGFSIASKMDHKESPYAEQVSRVNNFIHHGAAEYYVDAHLNGKVPYLRTKASREVITIWREKFNEALMNSKMAYADGGTVHVIVNKFFEIPARGAVMLCDAVCGLRELGFNDGENVVIVTPDSVISRAEELLGDLRKMQVIADNSRKLVMNKHTAQKRAEDVISSIKRINAKAFHGSCWRKGEFIIK